MSLQQKRNFNATAISAAANGALAILSLALFSIADGVKMEPDRDLKTNEAQVRVNRFQKQTPERCGNAIICYARAAWGDGHMVVTVIRWQGRGGIFSLKYSEKKRDFYLRRGDAHNSFSRSSGSFHLQNKGTFKKPRWYAGSLHTHFLFALSTMLGV